MPPRGGKKKQWGDYDWVHEVETAEEIDIIHRRRAAGLEKLSMCPFNPLPSTDTKKPAKITLHTIDSSDDPKTDSDGVANAESGGATKIAGQKRKSRSNTITESDDEITLVKDTRCQAKRCSTSARCYNHLGAHEVLNETKAEYMARMLPDSLGVREEGDAAGLRNLGATCYVSRLHQLYRDITVLLD